MGRVKKNLMTSYNIFIVNIQPRKLHLTIMFKFLIKSYTDFKTNRYVLFYRNMGSSTKPVLEVMSNGLKVVNGKWHSPLFCASLYIRNGPRYETPCTNGISNFIESMCSCSYECQQNIHSLNTQIKSITTRDYQLFSVISPEEYATQSLELLFKMITDLVYDDNQIEVQKMKLCFEAQDYDSNPKALTFDYLHQTAFQGTSLGQSVIGPVRNIEKFDKTMVCNYKVQNFLPNRMLLAVSGEILHSIIDNMCLNLNFLSCMEYNPTYYSPQRYTGSQIVYRDDSMPYAHVALAIEAPGYGSSEYLQFLVASCLTGSWDRTRGGMISLGSPLARAASTSMLCEKFESFYIAYQDVGLWGVYFVGNKLYLDDMISNIQDQWMHMCTTIVQADVERAVNTTKLKLARQVNGALNSCRDIGLQLLYKSEWKSLSDAYGELSQITNKMIKNIGYKYIYDKCPVVAAIGPTETLPNYARIRSGMYWLRL